MRNSLEFILGLLDERYPAFASADDFAGEHGPSLRLWQRLGFLSREPEGHPVPSCPHCREGVPSRLGRWFVCDACHSRVEAARLFRWRFDLEAVLTWLGRRLTLAGGLLRIDDSLWRLGSLEAGERNRECLFRRGTALADDARRRLLELPDAVVIACRPGAGVVEGFAGPCVTLPTLLRQDKRALRVADLARLLEGPGSVRFDAESGTLWVGGRSLGSVPLHSREYHFLACLGGRAGQAVPYAEIKSYVSKHSGSRETTDEATFCHKLKSRSKTRIPGIDGVVTATNKGGGYQLRRVVGP